LNWGVCHCGSESILCLFTILPEPDREVEQFRGQLHSLEFTTMSRISEPVHYRTGSPPSITRREFPYSCNNSLQVLKYETLGYSPTVSSLEVLQGCDSRFCFGAHAIQGGRPGWKSRSKNFGSSGLLIGELCQGCKSTERHIDAICVKPRAKPRSTDSSFSSLVKPCLMSSPRGAILMHLANTRESSIMEPTNDQPQN
jgi:hypothetical protein